MTTDAEKLLERMRRSKSGWKRKDIDKLYLGYGFIIKAGKRHDIVTHPEFSELRDTLPRHNKLLSSYIADAVKLVDMLIRLREERDQSEEAEDEDE